MWSKYLKLFLIVSFFLITSCIESGGSGTGSDFIPDIEAACSPAQVPGSQCSGTGQTVYVGLSSNSSIDCTDVMADLGGIPFRTQFNASGTASATQVGYLSATITNWVNASGGVIDVLAVQTYKACAFVDINSNGELDNNEPFGQGYITPGVQPASVTDWDVF